MRYFACDVCGLMWDNTTNGPVLATADGRHLCVKHFPFPVCVVCGEPMHAKKRKVPGVPRRQATGEVCTACADFARRHPDPAYPPEVARRVREVLPRDLWWYVWPSLTPPAFRRGRHRAKAAPTPPPTTP